MLLKSCLRVDNHSDRRWWAGGNIDAVAHRIAWRAAVNVWGAVWAVMLWYANAHFDAMNVHVYFTVKLKILFS